MKNLSKALKPLVFLIFFLVAVGCEKDKHIGLDKTNSLQDLEVTGSGNFGPLNFDESISKVLNFKNTSTSPLSLTPVLEGAQSNSFLIVSTRGCAPVVPQGVCSVRMMVSGKGLSEGSHQAVLKLKDLETIPVSVVVNTTPDPVIEVQIDGTVSNNLDFEIVGKSKVQKIIALRNIGPIVFPTPVISKDLADLTIITNGCNAKLLPSKICYLKVAVSGKNLTQEQTGTLSIGSIEIPVSINAEAQIQTPNLVASNENVDFGDFTSDGQKVVEILSFTNSGLVPANLDIQGLPPGYVLVASTCAVVPPRGKCFVRLQFTSDTSVGLGQHSSVINMGASQVNIISSVVSPTPLSSIEVSGLDDVLVGQCVGLQVSLLTGSDPFISSGDKNLSLSGGSFYSDSLCSSGISSKTIAPYQNQAVVYVSYPNQGLKQISIGHSSLIGNKSLGVFEDLTLTSPFLSMTLNDVIQLSAQGGKSPLTYSILSGSGSVSSEGELTAASAGLISIRVTDSMGQSEDISITAFNNLT